MKTSLAFLFLAISSSAFAISDEALAKKCTPVATEEIQRLNDLRGCTIIDKIVLADIDNRLMNPSKFLRFEYLTKCEDGEVRSASFIAQYFSKKCYVSNY